MSTDTVHHESHSDVHTLRNEHEQHKAILWWVLGLLGTVAVAGGTRAVLVGERVARVEEAQEAAEESLKRIEGKLDRLLERSTASTQGQR